MERNLYWVTDHRGNLRRAVDEIAAANGVTNRVTHFVYSHHRSDHGGAASVFDGGVVRIGHEQTRRGFRQPPPPIFAVLDDDPRLHPGYASVPVATRPTSPSTTTRYVICGFVRGPRKLETAASPASTTDPGGTSLT